jgi:hypothetical protein
MIAQNWRLCSPKYCIPNQFLGVIAMFAAMSASMAMPITDLSRLRKIQQHKMLYSYFPFPFGWNIGTLLLFGLGSITSPT